jgi:hypothetical protein
MQIAIFGAGNVGSTLGHLWATGGHAITYGVRNPDSPKVRDALANTPNATASSFRDAAAVSEVIVNALPVNAIRPVFSSISDWKGKTIIDTANRFTPPENGLSSAEELAAITPGAAVVKAFNTIGYNILRDPTFGDRRATLVMCGDRAAAKGIVEGLACDLNFDVIDAGSLKNARLLEAMAELWVHLAREYGRDIAFKLLRRNGNGNGRA